MKGRNYASSINGKRVVNAKRGITLHISLKDIKTASNRDPGACAAAKAALREIPNCTMARIHLGRAYIFNEKKEEWSRYKTTDALRNEIIALDRGGKFEPGDYVLRPLSPSSLIPKKVKKFISSDTNRNSDDEHTKGPRKLHVVKGVRRRYGANR